MAVAQEASNLLDVSAELHIFSVHLLLMAVAEPRKSGEGDRAPRPRPAFLFHQEDSLSPVAHP